MKLIPCLFHLLQVACIRGLQKDMPIPAVLDLLRDFTWYLIAFQIIVNYLDWSVSVYFSKTAVCRGELLPLYFNSFPLHLPPPQSQKYGFFQACSASDPNPSNHHIILSLQPFFFFLNRILWAHPDSLGSSFPFTILTVTCSIPSMNSGIYSSFWDLALT